jgi:hypothetical protein
VIDIERLRDEAVSEELDDLFDGVEADSNDLEIDEIALGARLEVRDD